MGCLSSLTMPLVSDSDCDGEHNFPLSRNFTSARLHVGHTKRLRATAGGVAGGEPPSEPTNKEK